MAAAPGDMAAHQPCTAGFGGCMTCELLIKSSSSLTTPVPQTAPTLPSSCGPLDR